MSVAPARGLRDEARVGAVVRRRSSRPLWLKRLDPGGKVLTTDAGWSSSVARRAHNPEVAGSNPVPATRKTRYLNEKSLRYRVLFCSDKAESLCYSLPFVRTHSRRRGGGGGLSPNIEDYQSTPLRGVRPSSPSVCSQGRGGGGGFVPPKQHLYRSCTA